MPSNAQQPNRLVLDQIHGKGVPNISAQIGEEIVLGRSPGCTSQLSNRYVSRKHASLVWSDDRWILHDLKSRSGTYLNTIRMESDEEVQLHDGDLIQIGPWKFLVRLGEQEEELDQEMIQEIDRVPQEDTGDEVPTLIRTVNGRYETNLDLSLMRL